MSAYKNFTGDFPSRCLEILDQQKSWAKFKGRDVTLLLMVASAAFLIPFERLKPTSYRYPHPSGDNEKFAELSEDLKDLMTSNFIESRLSPNKETTWKFKANVPSVSGDLDDWFPKLSMKPISRNKTVSPILKVIRNALAHGNVFTTGNPIETLIFVTTREVNTNQTVKFEVLSVGPEDFSNFIREWVCFLRESQIEEFSHAA
jgi:hypothetical protein